MNYLLVFSPAAAFQLVLLSITFGCQPATTTIFWQDFNDNPGGTYDQKLHAQDFPGCPWEQGVARGKMSETTADGPYALEMYFPKGEFGPGSAGGQWPMPFMDDTEYRELVLEYDVKFSEGFDWRSGGKLPGLTGGGPTATGGTRADGTNGWSARIMWRKNGTVMQYAYHMDQPTQYGDDWYWIRDGEKIVLEPDRWYRVKTRIKMNTPGLPDGVCESWLDGEKVLAKHDVRWRSSSELKIDTLYFSTFFGGNEPYWAPKIDCYISFDRFHIWEPRPSSVVGD